MADDKKKPKLTTEIKESTTDNEKPGIQQRLGSGSRGAGPNHAKSGDIQGRLAGGDEDRSEKDKGKER